ncbi:MAG TPA: S-methyl-5-thioribose-1-phosphate isomerase [Synergistetes bacterium]|nr:S-methyl-5-thioribose-1-phosphate isomerase [Synergistota bacterium]
MPCRWVERSWLKLLPETIKWDGERESLMILDQTLIPEEIKYLECKTVEEVALCIETMKVRGAPAIGIAAAYGLVFAASEGVEGVMKGAGRLSVTRPTAINLFWALERMKNLALEKSGNLDLVALMLKEADMILEEDIEANRAIGRNGQIVLPDICRVLSHCNAGALATGGYGTALGVFRAARDAGKDVTLFLDETRPLFQGARLSAWELMMDGFDVTIICEGMASWLMKSRGIDAVIVGADRIAANGDFANKIGTYGLAVAAKEHSVPFYVAAPSTTIDSSIETGEDIPIEERNEEEVRLLPGGMRIPDRVKVWNPAFDVTPSGLVTTYITDRGLFRPPFSFHK